MSVTVRRRVPRFDAGGSAPPIPAIGNPTSPAGSWSPGGGAATASMGQGRQLSPVSAGGYDPGTPGSWSGNTSGAADPTKSDAFTATAQGLPIPTNPQGFTPGPETNAVGSWGNAATNGIQGNAGMGGQTYTPGTAPSYQQPGTAGKYNAYDLSPGASATWTPNQPTNSGFISEGGGGGGGGMPGIPIGGWGSDNNSGNLGSWSPNNGAPIAASGGAIPEFRRGGAHGGFNQVGTASGVDVGPQTSDYRSPAQQQHDFDQADVSGRISKYFSQDKPVQDAIHNAQMDQQPQQQPQQQQQPHQQRRAGGGTHPMQRQQQQRMNDNALMQQLMKAGQQGSTPQVGAPQQADNNLPSVSPEPTGAQDQTPAGGQDQAIPDDSAGVQAGAEFGGLAEGGGIPEGPKVKQQRDPRAGVKAALSQTRQRFGLNDQVFAGMASKLGGGHYFKKGGPVDPTEPEDEDLGGPEDVASEDLPYKTGPREGQENLKGEANPQDPNLGVPWMAADGGAIPDDGDDDDGAEGEVEQMAGMIPAKPAGPGGDQPNPNPFSTKTPKIPFGKKTAKNDHDDDDQSDA